MIVDNPAGITGHPVVLLGHSGGGGGKPILQFGILGHPGGTRPGGELSHPQEIFGPTGSWRS